MIQRLLERGDYGTAFTVGQTTLLVPDLCDDDQRAIAELMLNAGLKVIATARIDDPGNAADQQKQVDRYRDLQALAQSYGVPMPETALSISRSAYASSSFLLAIKAYEDALITGETSASDMSSLRQYVSAARNIGEHYRLTGATPETREEGLRWMRTSALIDAEHSVGDGVAAGTLRSLFEADESGWPEPMPSPLLE